MKVGGNFARSFYSTILVALVFSAMDCRANSTAVRYDHPAIKDGYAVGRPTGNRGLTAFQLAGDALPPRHISITYDDGPDASTLALAQFLAGQSIRATFFVNGCRIAGQAGNACQGTKQLPVSTLNQTVDLGHRIANHAQTHLKLGATQPPLSANAIRTELLQTQAIVDPLVNDGYYLFRAPNNSWGDYPFQILSGEPALKDLVGPFIYDISSGDWACTDPAKFWPTKTPEQCAQIYYDALMKTPAQNGILQLHDRNPNAVGTSYTLQLTQALVAKLRAAPGAPFVFVPLDAVPGVAGTQNFSGRLQLSNAFADAAGTAASRGYYGTVRVGDINADGVPDVCGRRPDGVYCALGGSGTLQKWLALPDGDGWAASEYATTMQLVDLNRDGKADLCIRGNAGMYCFGSTGSMFGPSVAWWANAFSDANGWNTGEDRYGSIQWGDVDGNGYPDVCGRDGTGIVCQRFNGSSFTSAERWLSGAFDNANGWQDPAYGATLRLADVSGDGRADLCGRSSYGIVCAVSTGAGFAAPTWWSNAFSDAEGWRSSANYYRTLQYASLDGTGKAGVCGRTSTGIVCARSDGKKLHAYHHVDNSSFIASAGWANAVYGAPLQFADANRDGRLDICLRSSYGVACLFKP